MKPTSLLFFSSSPIALPLFEALLNDKRFEILGLVCQPDRPAGRGQKLTEPATKVMALEKGVPVFQPEKLSKDIELLERFKKNPPDFLLTFAYGQLLSGDWLSLPTREPLNVHPSLLPKYRGPSPLESALLHNEKETGITLMKMVAAMDAGSIAFQRSFPLPESMTAGELYEEVAKRAAEWIPNATVELVACADFVWRDQNENEVSFCSKLSKEDSFEDFKRDDADVLNRYRAFTPWPGLWTTFEGKRVKLLKLKAASFSLLPGHIEYKEDHLFVGTQGSAVEILSLQMEGKKESNAAEFLRGYPTLLNAVLPS
jgi:methionyl-tRNA formyltransferase